MLGFKRNQGTVQAASSFRFPSSTTYSIQASGTTFTGSTNFLINGPSFTAQYNFQLTGTLILIPGANANAIDVGLRLANPFVGTAGATQFGSNTAVHRQFGGNSNQQIAALDIARVSLDSSSRTARVSLISDTTSRTSQLNSFNWRTSLATSIYTIIRGTLTVRFNSNGSLRGGEFNFQGESFTGGGTAAVSGRF
ncbi:hypothetical protein WJX72_000018 [[Myrmecia] bisecta]|uniref:Uncharacterized protein n=1 Tax=[Myrmecia] bisecta TaxID=41462 RepID=A0AAW1QNT3_9CHLO